MTVTRTQIAAWLTRAAAELEANKEYLTELDAAIGDADHGNNMARGFNAVVDALPAMEGQDIGAMLKRTGMVLMSKVGGASGMLYSNFFLKAAAGAAGKDELTDAELGELLTSGLGGIVQRGRAEPGDKTMIDAWNPAVAAFSAALTDTGDLAAAMAASVDAARAGMEATVPMIARKGRASYLGERSAGHQDPGATSTVLLLESLAAALREEP
ncbi:MAG: dihydroxyacetone kinase subunit L [Caldilineaceae bacterium]|nr:dihydroxyacetone kinase subunit L [Caldilineaceae bacterium]